MMAYIIRRLLYAVPILVGVNVVTFALFFLVNTPDDMARMQLGIKRVTPEAIASWKQERGYDKPLLYNAGAAGAGAAGTAGVAGAAGFFIRLPARLRRTTQKMNQPRESARGTPTIRILASSGLIRVGSCE